MRRSRILDSYLSPAPSLHDRLSCEFTCVHDRAGLGVYTRDTGCATDLLSTAASMAGLLEFFIGVILAQYRYLCTAGLNRLEVLAVVFLSHMRRVAYGVNYLVLLFTDDCSGDTG